MARLFLGFVVGALFASAITFYFYGNKNYEIKLNTANTIRAAWELRRLSDSLAKNVDTKCYIAKLAYSQVDGVVKAAEVVADHPASNKDSAIFAVKSASEALDIFAENNVLEIVERCESGADA